MRPYDPLEDPMDNDVSPAPIMVLCAECGRYVPEDDALRAEYAVPGKLEWWCEPCWDYHMEQEQGGPDDKGYSRLQDQPCLDDGPGRRR